MNRGFVQAGAAMFLVGTLAAVSATIHAYPVPGGQAIRYAIAGAILLAIIAARRRSGRGVGGRLTFRDVLLIFALAATGLAAFSFLVVEATRYASPAMVGMIVAAVPVGLALAGPLQERRRPSPRVVLAAGIVVGGVVLTTGIGTGSPLGALLATGAFACEVLFTMLAVPLLPKLGALRVSAYSSTAAVPLLIVWGLIADGPGFVRMPTPDEALSIGYLAVVATAFAFLLWYDAVPRLGADRAGLFAGMMPVGAIITMMVLGLGMPSAADLAGAALVIAGILLGLSADVDRVPDARRPAPSVEVEQIVGDPRRHPDLVAVKSSNVPIA